MFFKLFIDHLVTERRTVLGVAKFWKCLRVKFTAFSLRFSFYLCPAISPTTHLPSSIRLDSWLISPPSRRRRRESSRRTYPKRKLYKYPMNSHLACAMTLELDDLRTPRKARSLFKVACFIGQKHKQHTNFSHQSSARLSSRILLFTLFLFLFSM